MDSPVDQNSKTKSLRQKDTAPTQSKLFVLKDLRELLSNLITQGFTSLHFIRFARQKDTKFVTQIKIRSDE